MSSTRQRPFNRAGPVIPSDGVAGFTVDHIQTRDRVDSCAGHRSGGQAPIPPVGDPSATSPVNREHVILPVSTHRKARSTARGTRWGDERRDHPLRQFGALAPDVRKQPGAFRQEFVMGGGPAGPIRRVLRSRGVLDASGAEWIRKRRCAGPEERSVACQNWPVRWSEPLRRDSFWRQLIPELYAIRSGVVRLSRPCRVHRPR